MSWQLRYLNLILKHLARPRLRRVGEPAGARAEFERFARVAFYRPPFLTHINDAGGMARISCGATKARRIVLYLHGGAYIAGSAKSHAAMLGRLSRLSGVEVCAPDYPLAPEAPFPKAFEGALAAWQALMAQGYRPKDIVIGGDSAGGGLALALLSHLCGIGTPPAALFAMSPWTDLTLASESLQTNADRDPFLPVERIRELIAYILPEGAEAADPRLSPLFGAFPDCPPILLHYGETEILRDDSRRMGAHLRECGAELREEIHPSAPHVWHLFDGWIPEARASLQDIAGFIRAHL